MKILKMYKCIVKGCNQQVLRKNNTCGACMKIFLHKQEVK